MIKAELGSLDWIAMSGWRLSCLMGGQRREGGRHLDSTYTNKSCALSLEFRRIHTVFESTPRYHSAHHGPLSYL
jgi:hypothetical protein